MSTLAKPIPTDAMREYLKYDPDTGIFRWIKRPKGSAAAVGDIAGRPKSTGYLRIRLLNREYYCHRVAWAFVYGECPPFKHIDHIDHVVTNNAISNLRLASVSQNQLNRSSACGKSKYKGVTMPSYGPKFRAKFGGKWIGCFDNAIDCHRAYCAAAYASDPEHCYFGDESPFTKADFAPVEAS